MPEMDGAAFIRAVRAHPHYRDVPALAVSGMARRQDVERALAAGFSAHVGKPVDMAELSRKVAQLLEKNTGT